MSSNVHYINERDRHEHTHMHNGRTLAGTVNEVKEEVKQFAETRLAMLQSEMKEKIATIKASAPMLVGGAVIGIAAFFVLTAALCALLTAVFAPSPYATFLGCVIVGVVYAIVGGLLLFMGYKSISEKGLVPERTIQVLKDDKTWLQNEARTQL